MKGQMFIIAMIFMIAIIVLVRNMVSTLELTEENIFQEGRIAEKNMRNYANEFDRIAAASSARDNANQTALGWLTDFSLRLREDQDVQILFVFIATNASAQRYSIAIGNYLGDNINLSYNVTNSSLGGYAAMLQDRSIIIQQHAPLINGTIEFNMSYAFKDEQVYEKFNFTNSAVNNILLFKDITAASDDLAVRGKDIFRWSWPV